MGKIFGKMGGRLLNGVKTYILGDQLIRFHQILGATRQFQYENA